MSKTRNVNYTRFLYNSKGLSQILAIEIYTYSISNLKNKSDLSLVFAITLDSSYWMHLKDST